VGVTRRGWLAIAGGVVVAGVAVLGALVWRDGPAPVVDPAAAVPIAAARPGPRVAVAPDAAPVAVAHDGVAPATLPGSLDGTEADGELAADAGGHLIVTIELRRLFDHFLAASGEEPIATMRARIIAALRAKLPPIAAGEAVEILDRYLGYRDAARTLTPRSDPAAGLGDVHDLRAKWFSPAVARAFFADEEAGIYAGLARRDVATDPSLSDADRAAKLAEIDGHLPAADRAARAAATAPIDEMAREAQLRTSGASDAQIAAARTAAFGADGAARLAELDRAHAAWDARLAQFRTDRAALINDPSLTDGDRRQRVADLLARSFTPEEQLRVAAILHLPPGGP
jgi:lipase chaperone LimK